MKRSVIISVFSILTISGQGFGQVLKDAGESILFHGLVMDAGTEQPLSDAQIIINRSFRSITNSEGEFAFYVNHYDTIVFNSLGYKSTVMYISDTLTAREFIAGIYMQTDTVLIGEVVIFPRLTSLRSDLFRPETGTNTDLENAKYNLSISAYQGRVNQNKLGDPESNYEFLRQKQKVDAYSNGQIPPDQMISLSPLMLVPAAYLLIYGLPEKPQPLQPRISDQEVNQIHKKYMEILRKK